MEYEVNAIERPGFALSHDGITAIGNDVDGWAISTASAIHRIRNRRELYYVRDVDSGRRVYLAALRDKFGRTTLRAMSDGHATNHLLALKPLRDCCQID